MPVNVLQAVRVGDMDLLKKLIAEGEPKLSLPCFLNLNMLQLKVILWILRITMAGPHSMRQHPETI